MKLGVVIHGPEVIDSGQTEAILEKLAELGEVHASLGGTMGKTAVLDAGLEGLIDISRSLKPSACIDLFFENCELVCLLNRGKTVENGQVFGAMVAARLPEPEKKPLLQIESPGIPEGKVIPLNEKGQGFVETVCSLLGLPVGKACGFEPACCVKTGIRTGAGEGAEKKEKRVVRQVSGVLPGENILVNGIVIGKAESVEVRIVSEAGFITALEGGRIKDHGLEKLHKYEARVPLDLEKAWVKSGSVRRSLPTHKNVPARKEPDLPTRPDIPVPAALLSGGRVVLIDHAAEKCFELAREADFAVTIGDDTTAIAGDILSRLGIPILGITDGDCDEVAEYTQVLPGSLVLRLQAGKDDIVGRLLKTRFFNGEVSATFEDIHSLKKEILELAEPLTEKVLEY